MGTLLRLRSTIVRPSDATQYAAGDEVSNNATANAVVLPTFDVSAFKRGRILLAEIDILAASGNVVTTAADFELLIWRTINVPAAVGDNVTNPLAAATRALAVARFRFDDTGWMGPLGTVAAGTSQEQTVMPTVVQPLATNVLDASVPYRHFSLEGMKADSTRSLTASLRAIAAWNPGAVVNTIGITLDIDVE